MGNSNKSKSKNTNTNTNVNGKSEGNSNDSGTKEADHEKRNNFGEEIKRTTKQRENRNSNTNEKSRANSNSNSRDFVIANGIFALTPAFYRASESHGKLENGNFVCSSFGLAAAFAMLKIGTKGETTREMEKALHFPQDDAFLLYSFKQIFQSLNSGKKSNTNLNVNGNASGFALTCLCKIYIDKNIKISEGYEKSLKNNFGLGGEIKKLELIPAAAQEINKWISHQTNGKVKDIIASSDLHPLLQPKMVLVNVLCFEGRWQQEFQKRDTLDEYFYVGENEDDAIVVEMMGSRDVGGRKINIVFLKEVDADVFEMNYRNDRFSLLIFLPRSRMGLQKLEKNLEKIPPPPQIFRRMTKALYRVSIPRFEIECTVDLKDALRKMGVHKIFADVDFSGMTKDRPLTVTKAVQRALLTVDEKGTEEAEDVDYEGKEPGKSLPPKLVVDHPFYFQLVDKKLELILSCGACSHPQSPKSSFAQAKSRKSSSKEISRRKSSVLKRKQSSLHRKSSSSKHHHHHSSSSD